MTKPQDNLDTEARLRERVKELSCLYEVVRIADRPGASFDEVLQEIAELLPPAWQYPEITSGRIILDERVYCKDGFKETSSMQSAKIVVGGEIRGCIEVVYLEQRPQLYEGPFLKEERNLINALGREISGIVERHQAREETAQLEEQLRHADRLATIGQLAAGVAHELNEPLGNILGFAQLAEKADGLPKTVGNDLNKIVEACLHAREIVSKLRIFARQMPAQKKEADLNEIVSDGLFFIESRCAKQGIETIRDLDETLPVITADSGQLLQILTNLTVNAVQAMPDGGQMTVRTYARELEVALVVEDTGAGMSPELQKKIFLPFFTTKDVDQGTGLGLSVVEGIVKAHGGTIEVSSRLGVGSRFEVRLPISDSNVEQPTD
ncbi:MAG: PAS domain-containing sensor histidine kinase [Deltaproteobacteria bacterium]|nr:PAS domain-containing sensor histidine kinase [Deltaproteobacteria bacterium]